MKLLLNITKSFALIFLVLTTNLKPMVLLAQTVYPIYYHVITLQKDSIQLDNRNFYIKSIVDCRADTTNIGIIKEGLFDNKYPAKLDTNLSLSLTKYFDELMPAMQAQTPIIIKITRFNIVEKADANTDNGTTTIAMEFYTQHDNTYSKIFETEQITQYTYFDVTKLHEQYIRETLKKCIKAFSFSKNYIETAPITYNQLIIPSPIDYTYNEPSSFKPKVYYSKVNFTISGGFGYFMGKFPQEMPKELKNYVKGMRFAENFATDFSFFLTKKIGVGFNFANYTSNNSIDYFKISEKEIIIAEGSIANNINIKRYGPSISYRKLLDKDNIFLKGTLSFERLHYTDEAVLFNKPNKIDAYTSCLVGNFGIDYFLFKNIGLNFALSAVWGNIKKMEVNGIATELEKKSSLLRTDVNVGITLCY